MRKRINLYKAKHVSTSKKNQTSADASAAAPAMDTGTHLIWRMPRTPPTQSPSFFSCFLTFASSQHLRACKFKQTPLRCHERQHLQVHSTAHT